MFQKIIVPLDGSPSSETALGTAEQLAQRLGSTLVLLHVLESRPPRLVHGERHLSGRDEAAAYLAPVAARLRSSGVAVETHVHEERVHQVAASVAAHEIELGNDLVVMAAHGRHGLLDALSGSLPLKVAAAGGAAVLLTGSGGELPTFAPKRIVVPLDGRPDHEAALPATRVLATAFGLDTRLVSVVPRRGSEAGGAGPALAQLAPIFSGASLEFAADEAARYLAETADRLESQGLKADWKLLRGRPARAIAAAADSGDLIALSTHRRFGLDASLDGCVAFGVAGSWRGHLLIVPVPR